jgi:TolA-binding protein
MNSLWQKKPALVAFLALLLASSLTRGLSASEDKIILFKLDKNGKNEVKVGHIKGEDASGVVLEERSQQGTVDLIFKPEDISNIDWSMDDPAYAQDWSEAIKFYGNGEYSRAAHAFKVITDDKDALDKFRPEAKPCLFFLYGESLSRCGKTADAVKIFETLVKDYRNSHYTLKAVGSIVEDCIITGEVAKVQPFLEILRSQGGERKAWADFYEGKVHQAKKEYSQANKFFGVSSQESNSQELKGRSLMAQAECAIAEDKTQMARDLAKTSLLTNPPPFVAAGAHLVLGEALLAESEKQKASGVALENMLLDAILEFMHVSLLYGGDRATEPKALFKAAECFLTLSKKCTDRGYDRQRAFVLYSKLKEDPRWQGTEWANKANEALEKLR